MGAALWRGSRGRCPRCGTGALFDGYLTVVAACAHCGLDLAGHDSGDGPAVLVMFVLGFIAVGLALAVEVWFQPPLWVHAVLWTPVVIGGSIAMLRPLKGMTIALQYALRSTEEHGESQ